MRAKKPNQEKKREQLLTFIQKHNSLSPLTTHKSLTSLAVKSKPKISSSRQRSPNDSSLKKFIKSASNTDLYKKFNPEDPDLAVFLSQLKEKLEKVETTSSLIEKWKDSLTAKEKELVYRESKIKETEQKLEEVQRMYSEKLKKIEKKEKDLIQKESNFASSKEKLLKEVSMNIERKSKEIAEQERKLKIAVNAMTREMEKLSRAKEEAIKIECSVLLNELIGCIVFTDYQTRNRKFCIEYNHDSFDENSIIDAYGSNGEFERIEEVSNENSRDDSYDANSSGYIEQRDKILMECDEIGRENQDISDKLEALILSLNPTGELD